ncbi:MAG TPA: amidase [Candidatus Binataceae bacterium]
MSFPDELFFGPASRLVAMLRARDVSAGEMVSAFLDRIESINPKLNAIVTLAEERAIEEAEESDRRLAGKGEVRPLEGLPITVKDHMMTAGIRSTIGMKIFEHFVPQEDAPTVARLRAAGAVIIAKTNVPEMVLDYDCENPLFGATNNPWNLARVPGGSSGGEAAALASGMSALGLGSDLGGSIRLPAHFCGIAGLKPSWGTVPSSGLVPPGPAAQPPIAAMGVLGPMARHVDDLTLSYNIIKGPHPSSPYTAPTPIARPDVVDLKKLRCAVFTSGGGIRVASEIREATQRAARALSKRGLAVEEATPPLEGAGALWTEYMGADGNELLLEVLGDKVHLSRERLRRAFAPGPGKSAAEFFRIAMRRDAWRVELANFMERYPILICPPFCTTAFAHGAVEVEIDGSRFPYYAAGWPVMWVNLAGLAAAVIPAGQDRDGLPIGVQIVGRAFDEEGVLAVAKVLEQDLGGFQKPPL